MVAVFVAYWGLATLHLWFWVVLILCTVIIAIIAVVEERLAIRLVRKVEGQLVTTVGWATILTGAVEVIWGPNDRVVPSFVSSNAVTVLGGRVLPVGLVLIGTAILVASAIQLWLRRTMLGLACLATSEDGEAAVLRGVNVRRLSVMAFAASGALAGLVAIAVGPQTLAYDTLGSALALKGFVAMAVGGFGSIQGSLLGGLATGIVEAMAARYLGGNFPDLAVFALLTVVLLTKPTGVFGTVRERVV
jgi:branched-chain amino acid transport system permease protein